MKITEALKGELAQWLETYWTTYIKGDYDRWATFVADDYYNIGGTKEEIWHSKQEILEYSYALQDQMVDQAEIRNRKIEVLPYGEYVMVNEFTDLFVKIEGEWTFYGPFRMSSLMSKTDTGWIALHQHGSYPDMKATEGEAFASDVLKAENKRLQEAVDQRTTELLVKNRELEIEAALEKVRSRTMAMRATSELQEVIYTVHQELLKLEIGIFGGSFIAINSEIDQELRCWGSGGTADTSDEVHIPYFDKPFYTNLVKGLKGGPAFFTEEFTQEEKKEFFTFLITNEPWSDLKTNEKKEILSSRGGYTRSCFVSQNTSIFIINHFGEKFSEEENEILRRFGKVFEQTYTRFLDLQKAEAQAREAEIELALERVRASTMAMHSSSELAEASILLDQQVRSLRIQTWGCAFHIYADNDAGDYEWFSSANGGSPFYRTPREQFFLDFYERGLRGEKFYVKEFVGAECKAAYNYLKTIPVAGDSLLAMEESGIALPTYQIDHVAFFKHGYILFITYEPVPEAYEIFQRFAKVFEQTYTRFLDLQKAEAQAREAQIEAALERVRSKTMAMHNSQEVGESVAALFDELSALGLLGVNDRCGIGIMQPNELMEAWTAAKTPDGKAELTIGFIDMKLHPMMVSTYRGWVEKKEINQYILEGEDKVNYYDAIKNQSDYSIKRDYYSGQQRIVTTQFYFKEGCLYVFSENEFSAQETAVFIHFVGVFGQTYKRYLDLQKAEAQAREAQIEAALERVRSRTMGMQHSDELTSTATLLFQQVQTLGVPPWSCGFNIWEQGDSVFTSYMGGGSENFLLEGYKIPLTEEAAFIHFQESRDRGDKLFVDVLEGEALEAHYRYFFTLPGIKEVFENAAQEGLPRPTFQINHLANFKHGNLMFITYEPCPEAHDIFIRFAKVFEQTYTRFLDLQKSEAQAKEAQIEGALERVRSRTMSMQNSSELAETAIDMFKQMQALGVPPWACGFNIFEKDERAVTQYMAGADGLSSAFTTPLTEDPFFIKISEARQRGEELFVMESAGQELEETYKYMFSLPGSQKALGDIMANGFEMPKFQISHCAFFSQGYLMFITYEPYPEAYDIFKRFAKVFEQTYTRFLDLQKAEAQAREAEIQLALERVRARTMAMQRSEELADAATVLFQQVKELGVPQWLCGFSIWDIGDTEFTWYPGSPDGEILQPSKIPLTEHPVFISFDESRRRGDELFVYEKEGEFQADHYRYMKSLPGVGGSLQSMLDAGLSFPTFQIDHLANFSHGNLSFITYEHFPEMHDVFKRFAKVFEQTYTRFLDLQKAEAQAKEATKQAALDRVRGEIASMRTPEDLDRITPLMWKELNTLGISFIRCGVFIMNEPQNKVHTYLSTPDGQAIAAFQTTLDSPGNFAEAIQHWHNQERYVAHWGEKDFKIQADDLVQQGAISSPEEYLKTIPKEGFYLHFSPFQQGMLYVGSMSPLLPEDLQLVQALGDAFSVAYARYEDFTKLEEAKQSIETTLSELKATQSQLIQAEKMASLGELTAGIAHEIQNPLNFVNNFSEVSAELVDEMNEELEKGDVAEAKAIGKDLKENLSKINHHGKRADAIVKGMLEHSRANKGEKVPTDLNALTDEFVRLSYHGLRAKDKSFNADFKLELDPNLPKVNVITSDIGRVILNLVNNAFYAVHEKAKSTPQPPEGGEGYKPEVIIKSAVTKSPSGDLGVQISVQDNGSGIPDSIKEKIFQPFFTTKPTGSGTGLGLSLSYDIVKAHGGKIKMETNEGFGTEFTIFLPLI